MDRITIIPLLILSAILVFGTLNSISLKYNYLANVENNTEKKVQLYKKALNFSIGNSVKKSICLDGLDYFKGNDAVYCYELLVKSKMNNYKIHQSGMYAYEQIGEYDKAITLAKTYAPEHIKELQRLKANKNK